jgi:hypothetical protein
MLLEMALIDTLIKKHGETIGREKFNAYHRSYRKRNKKKLQQYWKDRRTAQKIQRLIGL